MTLTDDSATNLPPVLYKADLAQIFRKSARSIDRLHRSGRLPDPLDIPGRPCWSRNQILNWLETGAIRRRR
jgi:hypothetical protein